MLIVEDDEGIRRGMSVMLAAFGRCDEAPDGNVAIALAVGALEAQDPYKVIFLDLGLPGVNGLEVLKVVRELEYDNGLDPDTWSKVIVTTGDADSSHIQEAFDDFAAAYLLKPVDPSELAGALRKVGFREHAEGEGA